MDWITALQNLAEQHNALVTLLTLVVGAFALFAMIMVGAKARDGIPSLGETLQDRASWPALITRWRGTGGQSYDTAVADLLTFADWLYGPRPLSWRAFDRCLLLAFLYPLIAVLLGWVLFNSHNPAGLILFLDEPHVWSRFWRALVLIGSFSLTIWMVANAERFAGFVVDRIFGPSDTAPARPGFLSKAGRAGVEFLAVAVAVAFAFAFAFAGAAAFAGAGAGAVAVAFAFAFAGAAAGAAAAAFFNDDPELAALVFLLYVFLPILNAVADWISLAITRTLLRAHPAGQHRALTAILLRAAGDLALAILCLAGLLIAISYGLTLWGQISPASLPFTAADYMAEVIADPSQGVALYLMVTTTLLPTFLHFGLGLGAILSHKGHLLSRAAETLDAKLSSGADLTVIERGDLVAQVRLARWAGYGAAFVITSLIFALVIYPIWAVVF